MDDKYWKLGIIGWPLGYSLSPVMHTAALKACGLRGEYREIEVKPEELERWLETKALEIDGFNVTMPHKEAVYLWLKRSGEINPVADDIGAVNTVRVKDGRLSGYNTDGRGFYDTVSEKLELKGGNVLLLGAGGAAQAIAVYLTGPVGIGSLKIWNRHVEKARDLARKINSIGNPCRVQVFPKVSDVSLEGIDLVVNATPLGMRGEGEIPQEVLSQLNGKQVVYDIVYEPRDTGLITAATQKQCQTITGEKMLAAQGAEAFEIWTDEWRGGKPIRVDGKSIREIMTDALEDALRQPRVARG